MPNQNWQTAFFINFFFRYIAAVFFEGTESGRRCFRADLTQGSMASRNGGGMWRKLLIFICTKRFIRAPSRDRRASSFWSEEYYYYYYLLSALGLLPSVADRGQKRIQVECTHILVGPHTITS